MNSKTHIPIGGRVCAWIEGYYVIQTMDDRSAIIEAYAIYQMLGSREEEKVRIRMRQLTNIPQTGGVIALVNLGADPESEITVTHDGFAINLGGTQYLILHEDLIALADGNVSEIPLHFLSPRSKFHRGHRNTKTGTT